MGNGNNPIIARDTALLLLLFPLLAVQALWVIARAQRLPEPPGLRSGMAGAGGTPLRLLVLGDSSAAGVGADHQSRALAPQIAKNFGQRHAITWTLAARNGATMADATALLAPLNGAPFDTAFVVFGVNDVKNMRRETAWRHDTQNIINMLQSQHGCRTILFSALPPMGRFPLLPRPLRTVLGLRAARFEKALAKVISRNDTARLVLLDLPLTESDMAKDGFHPGPAIYSHWAEQVAKALEADLTVAPTKPAR